MKKVLAVFGVIIWLLAIGAGISTFVTTQEYNNLAAVVFIIVVPILVICIVKSKNKKKSNNTGENVGKTVETKKEIVIKGTFKHINGLDLAENTICTVFSYPDRYEFSSGALKFNLPKDKVVDVVIKTDVDTQKQYVSSVGGAVGGAVLFGPLGAMIGGRAKAKKLKTTTRYLIITYKNDDELKYIGFDVNKDLYWAQWLEKEFKRLNNSVTNVDL